MPRRSSSSFSIADALCGSSPSHAYGTDEDEEVGEPAECVLDETHHCNHDDKDEPRSSGEEQSTRRRTRALFSGYSKPIPTPVFAHSARLRDSVVALGDISHLQSYFASRANLTGGFLPEEERERFFGLDGERRAASNAQVNMPPAPWPPANSVMSTSSVVSLNGTKVKEPRKTAEYHRMQLRNSLLSLRLLISSTNENPPSMIQILAQATAAIRQTRDYVCQHYSAQLTLESDRRLRQDALGSLEVIRHTSECNEMQLTPAKRQILNRWTEGVQRLLDEEETVRRDFTSASWFVNHAMGTWEDTYLPFLTYFDTMLPSLSPSITQTDVLTALRDGQRLCQIHNNCQAFIRSRPFYAIRSDLIHSDTTLQYRGVENLTRWWVAVERSWLVVDNTLSALMPWSPDAAWRGEGHGVQALKERIELFCSAAVRVLVAEA